MRVKPGGMNVPNPGTADYWVGRLESWLTLSPSPYRPSKQRHLAWKKPTGDSNGWDCDDSIGLSGGISTTLMGNNHPQVPAACEPALAAATASTGRLGPPSMT